VGAVCRLRSERSERPFETASFLGLLRAALETGL
jgi:hypothetical protein